VIRNLTVIALFLIISSGCKVSKEKTPQNKGVSSSDFPYIQQFHEGVRMKTRGQLNEAILAFEECTRLKENDDASYYALSQLYLMNGDPVRSQTCITKAAEIDPSNIWYTQELAYMYFKNGNFDESVRYFEKLLKNQPGNVEWLYSYAECLVKAGRIPDAIKALDRTEERMGIIPDLTIQKFRLYIQLKQEEKAVQEITKARKMHPNDGQLLGTLVDYYFQTGQNTKAIGMLEEMVKVDPENGRAQLALADVYRSQGKKKEAYNSLKMAFASDDLDIDTKMKILISINENPTPVDPEVLELLDLMITKYPSEAKSYSIKGDFMLRAGKNEEALNAFKTALVHDQNQYPIWNQVLIMEYEKNDYPALFEDSKTCLTLFPTAPMVFLLNGLSANQLDKHTEAIESLETGKELVINDVALESEFYGQLGEAYFGVKNLQKGRENYEKAIQTDPKSAAIKNNFAYRLAVSSFELELALTLIDEALTLRPENANFHDTKGFILFQQGKFNEALLSFQKADMLEPSNKIFVEHLGDGYAKLGDVSKAVDYWKKAKELGSKNKNIDKKIEKKQYFDPNY
jgi:tetratricopeptide (TPR) repeat protein